MIPAQKRQQACGDLTVTEKNNPVTAKIIIKIPKPIPSPNPDLNED